MKIASFNCNSIRARLPVIRQWLLKEQPDILCLQETKAKDEDFPVSAIKDTGYNAVFKGEKSYNGVAILSKSSIENVQYGFDGKGEDEGARIVAATIDGVSIVNTYIPQGTSPESEKFQYKLNWFRRLKEFFISHYDAKSLLLWVGDFNVAPEPIDVHDPKRLLGHVGFHPDEHKALANVKEWGFIDVFRKYNTDPGHYSFWDYRVRDGVDRGLGWRVDHIFATPPMADLSENSWIDVEPRLWEKPSDHTPIVAKFKEK